MAMPTLQEILAKVTGLESKNSDHEAFKASAEEKLKAATEAQGALEAKIAEQAKLIEGLKASEGEAEKIKEEENSSSKLLADLAKLIADHTGTVAPSEPAAAASAIKGSIETLKAQAITPEAVTKMVTAEIAKLGLQQPLSTSREGQESLKAQKPDGDKRAQRLVSTGFNEDPAIAALNKSLGRK